jgi:hypothetical protein
VHRADNLATFMSRLSRNSGSLKLLETSGPVKACTGVALPFFKYRERLHSLQLERGGVGWGVRMCGVSVDVVVTCEVYKLSYCIYFLSANQSVYVRSCCSRN